MRRIALASALTVVSLLLVAGQASAERGLTTGSADGLFLNGSNAERDLYLDRSVELDAGVVRLFVAWSGVVDGEPANATNPADPAYDFSDLDAAVQGARDRRLRVLLTTVRAPRWAEGGNRPKGADPGSWKPRPGATADFHQALARRYSGSFLSLPSVKYFQVWNEPNLESYLAPQWRGKRPVGADHYRKMLNASSRAIKSVNRSNVAVSAGMSPYGDRPGGDRTRPLRFWRDLFCLNGKLKRKCRARTDFDIFGEHAINTSGGPTRSALHPDDASSGDLPQMRKVLRAAERANTVSGRHPIWVTEFWWESNPPDRTQGVRLKTQARYVAQTMYLAWKAGASAAINLQLRDAKFSRATRFNINAAGIFFFNDEPKPSARALAFPFVGDGGKGRNVRLWGKAPSGGRVVVERKRGKRGWQRLKTLRAGRNGVFSGKVRIGGNPVLRARDSGEQSLGYRAR